MLEMLLPYGWTDAVMWLTVPFWAWTLWMPNKTKSYWLISLIVCVLWALFDLYIKVYAGVVLNIICSIVLILGWRKHVKQEDNR
jgi:hypothetical protein